jgi:hypothetical protein
MPWFDTFEGPRWSWVEPTTGDPLLDARITMIHLKQDMKRVEDAMAEHQKNMRIVIDEAAFRELVNGRVAKQRITPGLNGRMAEIILEDIGFARMYEILLEAVLAAEAPKE